MSTNVRTYILIGAEIRPDWGKLPTDGQGDQDAYDDWEERYGNLVIYDPKPGDLVTFADMDGAHYRYIGRVVDHFNDKWDYAEFNEAYDIARLTRELAEVKDILLEKYNIIEEVKLYIVSNCC